MADTPTLRGERIAGLVLWRGGPAAAAAVAGRDAGGGGARAAAPVAAGGGAARPARAGGGRLAPAAARAAPAGAGVGGRRHRAGRSLAFAVWAALHPRGARRAAPRRRLLRAVRPVARDPARAARRPLARRLRRPGAALDVPGLTFASPGFFETERPGLVRRPAVPARAPGGVLARLVADRRLDRAAGRARRARRRSRCSRWGR